VFDPALLGDITASKGKKKAVTEKDTSDGEEELEEELAEEIRRLRREVHRVKPAGETPGESVTTARPRHTAVCIS
jgi:hypothetical protein